jgi:hypothetical protein
MVPIAGGSPEALLADIEAGTMTWEELYSMFHPVRVATSPSGGMTMVARLQMQQESFNYVAMNAEGEITGFSLPAIAVPPAEEE